MFKKIVFIDIMSLLVACGGTPPASTPMPQVIPPSFVNESPTNLIDENYVIIQIDSIKVLQDGGDALIEALEGTEFKFISIVADGLYSSYSVSPSEGFYSVPVGEELDLGAFATIAFQEEAVQDDVYVYFLGVDSDELGAGNVFAETVAEGLAAGFSELVKDSTTLAGAILPKVLPLAGPIVAWMGQDDVLGEVSFTLTRDNDWGAGKDYELITGNGNLQINYTIVRSQTLPSNVYTHANTTSSFEQDFDTSTNDSIDASEDFYQEINVGDVLNGTIGRAKERDYLYIGDRDDSVLNVYLEYVDLKFGKPGTISLQIYIYIDDSRMELFAEKEVFPHWSNGGDKTTSFQFVPEVGTTYIIRVKSDAFLVDGSAPIERYGYGDYIIILAED